MVRELIALDVNDLAITELRVGDLVTDRKLRDDDTRSARVSLLPSEVCRAENLFFVPILVVSSRNTWDGSTRHTERAGET